MTLVGMTFVGVTPGDRHGPVRSLARLCLGWLRPARSTQGAATPTTSDRPPECPEHGLRPEVQTRDFCDVVDDYGPCGRFLLYEPELGQVRAQTNALPPLRQSGEA